MIHHRLALFALLALLSSLLASCADNESQVIVSVPDQRMLVLKKGAPVANYQVSTSRFCLSDRPGSNGTPLGQLEVASKIGDGLEEGAVLRSRRPTGEVIEPDAPGRDPIVTRILWLRGLEEGNRNAFSRCIYIHGTPEERNIGRPASYGCVRMRSHDIVSLYDQIGVGARVYIYDRPMAEAARPFLAPPPPTPPATPMIASTSPVVKTTEPGRIQAAVPVPPTPGQ